MDVLTQENKKTNPDKKNYSPDSFQVMLKPRGPICNLDCMYCYYLSKERLYPGSKFRMTDKILENFTRQYIRAQQVPEVTFAWQGGEPVLMGLDFYRRAVELQKKYRPPGMTIHNCFQTNGTMLDDKWGRFFSEQNFLVGLSLDGPRQVNDPFRVNKSGQSAFDKVENGLALLRRYRVDFNILACVHAANADQPLDVYRYFRDETGAKFIQFIPIVERDNKTGFQEGRKLTSRSVTGPQFGNFLLTIFDEWLRRDVGRIFIQLFDVALAAWSGYKPGFCVFGETCAQNLVLAHNGDLYACDHFVEPKYRLGNIMEKNLTELVASKKQRRFGRDKHDTLPDYCRQCKVQFVCNGVCPKDRILMTADGQPGLNYLCEGYKKFFNHIDRPMKIMASLLKNRRPPADIMDILAREDTKLQQQFAEAGRNTPCPCGSGRKFKRCHGRISQPIQSV